MAYNLLGQQGPKGSRNPDPNLSDAEATYLYDNPPGQGENKGLDAIGNPVDAKDVQEKLDENEPIRLTDGDDGDDEDDTSTNNNVSDTQQLLKAAGFDPGPIDGIIGPKTKAAAEAYINAARGQKQLNARRSQVNYILGLSAPTATTETETVTLYDKDGKPLIGVDPDAVQELLDSGLFFRTEEEAKSGTTIPSFTGVRDITLYDKDGNPVEFGDVTEKDIAILLNLSPPKYYETKGDATLNNISQFGSSIPIDATSYDVDKINAELGITNTAIGSAIKRGWELAMRGDLGSKEYLNLIDDVAKARETYKDDVSLAAKAGAFLRVAGMSAGFIGRGVGAFLNEFGAGVINLVGDLGSPDEGGVGDAFVDSLLGQDQGTNTLSNAFADLPGTGYRWDTATDSWFDSDNRNVNETLNNQITDNTNQNNNNNQTSPSQGGGESTQTPAPDFAYNAIGQYGPKGQSNEGYEYKFNDAPGRGNNPGVTKIGDPDPDFKTQTIGEPFEEIFITIYKDGAEKQILESDFALFEAAGWSRIPPDLEAQRGTTNITQPTAETTTGPGQVVSDQLNTFNNIPQNSVLIEAAGQLYLGYEVPGSYGQLYNGSPIFMLYEVLGNDVYEAGILTQGATPNINVKLGSVADLNQYGIVVGGTDELTDTVEHPFIRFVENFEAGKRVNPWLNDTEINPLTGITYQQEAVEFLAEQALEQWTPEETQVKYEASDWYRKSTTAQKTWLTTLLTQPVQAEQDIQDKRIEVKIAMEANGIASPPDALINWVADKSVSGQWTQVYTDQQVALLADPYKPGTRDSGMVNFIEGVGVGTLDRLTVGEKTVKDLYRRYLGPSLGNASDDEIAEKAGLLRSDPDAEEQLKAYLEQQRLAMFGNYTNPTLTYNDIVQPYKNLVNQVWGQQVDETQDWFIKMVQDNDIEKAYTTLREKGVEQGIERVQDQSLNDLQRSIGQGQIAPQLGANN